MNAPGQRVVEIEAAEPLPVIRRYPDPRLLTPCSPVTEWSDELGHVIAEMVCAVRGYNAAGLAAPQIGSPLRVILLRLKNGAMLPMVNPVVLERSDKTERGFEDCLSLPRVQAQVPRPVSVVVAYDTPLERKRLPMNGFDARVVQHEIDHLDGILLWDRLGETERRLLKRAFARKAPRWESPEAQARRAAGLKAGDIVEIHEPTNASAGG